MIGTLAFLAGMLSSETPQSPSVSGVEQDAEMVRSMAEIAAEMRRLGG
jgi:hypothetical protein